MRSACTTPRSPSVIANAKAHLGINAAKLNEANALELARLTVCGQAHSANSTAVSKGLCQLLTDLILTQVLVEALDKDGGALGVGELICTQKAHTLQLYSLRPGCTHTTASKMQPAYLV